ncbi:hypothetical protein GF314_04620, partial [bacterium]|nr:hypothetical protein [bacterium]
MTRHPTRPSARTGATALAVVSLVLCTGSAAAATWRPEVSAGYDTYVHTYHLAEDDTTETVSEYALTAGLAGRSDRRAVHRWSLRTRVSGGSELVRELLDGSYRWQPDGRHERLRLDVDWRGRQYQDDSEYSLTSDNHEGLAELRAYPWRQGALRLDVRARGRYIHYATPSSLEQSYREHGGAVYLASRGLGELAWRVGGLARRRAYPDSAAIDRDRLGLEADLNRTAGDRFLWLFHRSERRLAADQEVRPSGWSHWSELRLTEPAGPGHVVLDLTSEVWRYDREDATWYDSWRIDTEVGYGWGDPLSTRWQALVTIDRLTAADSPEQYTQVGLRGSVESYAGPLTGILALEYGRRWYADPD